MTSVIVQPEAEADIRSAHDWYESKQPGLGQQFIAELDRLLALLSDRHQIFPLFHAGCRRALVKRFPYAVLYIDRGNNVFVLGVLHQRRDPKLGRARVDDFNS